MVRSGDQHFITEAYVSVPPALTIIDDTGAVWTLGFRSARTDAAPRGEFAFNVVCNGRDTGVMASRIERHRQRIRAFTRQGWQLMHSPAADTPTRIYGVGVRQVCATMPVTAQPPIAVSIWRQVHDERPIARLAFDPLRGGDMVFSPSVICPPGQWLCATIRPVVDRVEVMAAVGTRNIRAIPIVNRDRVKE